MHEDPSQAAHSGDFLDQNTVGLMHPDEFHVRVQDPAGATPATQLTSSNPEPENLGDSSEIIRDGSTEAHQVHLANEGLLNQVSRSTVQEVVVNTTQDSNGENEKAKTKVPQQYKDGFEHL
ncbi:hypothetical protein PtB15_7B468 [Puccinia triticina]|nr:hypothetical protein PtB15_7B468 [Puccinia triticina]